MNAVPGRHKLTTLLVLTTLVLTGMLYFGIRFKGFRPANQIQWLASPSGIHFSRFGVAFTDAFFSPSPSSEPQAAGLAIEMAIQPAVSRYPDFRFILVVHDGADDRQLVVGQWLNALIIMNGDDYDGKRGVPKINVDLGAQREGPHLVTIVSGAAGTRVYLDGQLTKSNPNLHLQYPGQGGNTRLVVGNSVTARHPWNGSMFDLAMYAKMLADEKIIAHYVSWRNDHSLGGVNAESPRVLYLFEGGQGNRVANQAGNDFDLKVPARVTVLQKRFLELPEWDFSRRDLFKDMVVNLFGFIPLGLILCATMDQMGVGFKRYNWQISIFLAFLFSLGLETAQAWIPSRSSSMLDLLLNTLGAGIGAVGYKIHIALRKAA